MVSVPSLDAIWLCFMRLLMKSFSSIPDLNGLLVVYVGLFTPFALSSYSYVGVGVPNALYLYSLVISSRSRLIGCTLQQQQKYRHKHSIELSLRGCVSSSFAFYDYLIYTTHRMNLMHSGREMMRLMSPATL